MKTIKNEIKKILLIPLMLWTGMKSQEIVMRKIEPNYDYKKQAGYC